VPTLQDFHLLPAIAAALERLGWSADEPMAREATPTAARGHNLVVVTPPSPAYATPGLAGALSRVGAQARALLLGPAAQLDQWGRLVQRLTTETDLRFQVGRGIARSMRLLRANELDILITSLSVASALVARSALDLETIGSLIIAWPESWPDEDGLVPLLQDLPKESQRIIYTSDRSRVSSLVERYANKALTLGGTSPGDAPVPSVRTVSVAWGQRIQALADLVELLDPATLGIWTADRSYHAAIAEVIPPRAGVQIAAREPIAEAASIIAFDLPSPDDLRALGPAEVTLMVPPGTEAYVATLASSRRPIQLPGILDSAQQAEATQRAVIVRAIEAGRLHRSVATLAPLFERYDPVTVAAALLELWTASPATSSSAEAVATARVYVGAGRKDGVTPHDLVAVLTKDLRVERQKIGRIELRDTFALIEIPSGDAEQVARGLNGAIIRQRRVTARVDRGPRRANKPRV
jgi:ATP-dependent RNA helicase DeaD